MPLWYGASDALTHKIMKAYYASDEEELMQKLHIDFRRVRERYVGHPLEDRNIWGVKQKGGT